MSIEEEEEDVGYEVEEILQHRKTSSGYSYYLKWKGFSSNDNSWEDENQLDCKELLESYWEKVREDEKRKKEKESKELKDSKETKESKESKDSKDSKEPKHRRSEPRIKILGLRTDENGKLIFLTLNKYTQEKSERVFSYVKNHYFSSLIDFFESSLSFNSVINMKMSDVKIDKM